MDLIFGRELKGMTHTPTPYLGADADTIFLGLNPGRYTLKLDQATLQGGHY